MKMATNDAGRGEREGLNQRRFPVRHEVCICLSQDKEGAHMGRARGGQKDPIVPLGPRYTPH